MKLKVQKLHSDAVIPKYATPGASAFDLVAIDSLTIGPGETKLVKTGLAMEIPFGFELQVRPRSGMSLKTSLQVANSPGTVDSDYRGEICVIIKNTAVALTPEHFDSQTYLIKKGDRIAQGAVCAVNQAEFELVESLSETDRGTGGFGSSGA